MSNAVLVKIATHPLADIYIDNNFVGNGIFQGKVPAGVATFEARKEGYYNDKKDMEITAGDAVTVNLSVQPKLGSIDIVSNPLDAKVTLNGEEKGITPLTLQNLLIGNYELRIDKKGFVGSKKTIFISENKTTEVNEKLEVDRGKVTRSEAITPSKVFDKPLYTSDYYKYKKNKTIWLVSTLASGGVGAFSYLQAKSNYTQYQNATTDAENVYKKVQLYNIISPVAFAVAGFCAVEFVLQSTKQGNAKKPSLGLSPQPLDHGAGVNLVYKF